MHGQLGTTSSRQRDPGHAALSRRLRLGGIRIGNAVFSRIEADPWRFDTDSYVSAVRCHPAGPLTGTPADAVWDPYLRAAMADTELAVEEEPVLPELLDDLAH